MSTIRQIRGPRAYYNKMTVEQAQCRGNWAHTFPFLDPREDQLPEGYRIQSHDARGMYHITETCMNGCGKIRHSLQRWHRGKFEPVSRYWYEEGDDWVRVPRGILKPAMLRLFLQNDCATLLLAAAKSAEGVAAAQQ